MSKHFKDKPDNIVKTYSTAGGIKKEYKVMNNLNKIKVKRKNFLTRLYL